MRWLLVALRSLADLGDAGDARQPSGVCRVSRRSVASMANDLRRKAANAPKPAWRGQVSVTGWKRGGDDCLARDVRCSQKHHRASRWAMDCFGVCRGDTRASPEAALGVCRCRWRAASVRYSGRERGTDKYAPEVQKVQLPPWFVVSKMLPGRHPAARREPAHCRSLRSSTPVTADASRQAAPRSRH